MKKLKKLDNKETRNEKMFEMFDVAYEEDEEEFYSDDQAAIERKSVEMFKRAKPVTGFNKDQDCKTNDDDGDKDKKEDTTIDRINKQLRAIKNTYKHGTNKRAENGEDKKEGIEDLIEDLYEDEYGNTDEESDDIWQLPTSSEEEEEEEVDKIMKKMYMMHMINMKMMLTLMMAMIVLTRK